MKRRSVGGSDIEVPFVQTLPPKPGQHAALADRVALLVSLLCGGSVNRAAREWGIPQRTLSRIVSGETETPNDAAIARIGAGGKVSKQWLLSGEGKGPAPSIIAAWERKQQSVTRAAAAELERTDRPKGGEARQYAPFYQSGGGQIQFFPAWRHEPSFTRVTDADSSGGVTVDVGPAKPFRREWLDRLAQHPDGVAQGGACSLRIMLCYYEVASLDTTLPVEMIDYLIKALVTARRIAEDGGQIAPVPAQLVVPKAP